jgi:hypothetical protein
MVAIVRCEKLGPMERTAIPRHEDVVRDAIDIVAPTDARPKTMNQKEPEADDNQETAAKEAIPGPTRVTIGQSRREN